MKPPLKVSSLGGSEGHLVERAKDNKVAGRPEELIACHCNGCCCLFVVVKVFETRCLSDKDEAPVLDLWLETSPGQLR